MKRFAAGMVLVAGVVWMGGAAGATEQCVSPSRGVNGCVHVTNTNPAIAGVAGSTPLGSFDVHLGFGVRNFPGAECDRTHVGSVCLPSLYPAVYEIHAIVDAPQGRYEVQGYGSPAPCMFDCSYDVSVVAGEVADPMYTRLCYDLNRGVSC